MKATKPTGPNGPQQSRLQETLERLCRTRNERDGSVSVNLRSSDDIDVELRRWKILYDEQVESKKPRLALLRALQVCAEEGVSMPDWLAWDVRDAFKTMWQKGITLDDALKIQRFPKRAHSKQVIARQHLEARLYITVIDKVESGESPNTTDALKSLANSKKFPHSYSTLKRIHTAAQEIADNTEFISTGKHVTRHKLGG